MRDVLSYSHIIWDWNGTLFDDAWLGVEVMNKSLKKRGWTLIDLEDYRRVFCFPVINYYRRLGFDFEKERWEDVGTEWVEEYERRREEVGLHKGAREVLRSFKERGIGQSIVSAYKQESLDELIDQFALRSCFEGIHGLDDHYANSKEGIARRWRHDLEQPASEILFIGDTEHDVEVAKAIGVDCVLIPNGHQSRERLEKLGVRMVDDLEALLTANTTN